ncbi:hypothetical protein FALBO_8588 [Fusarium albosuccineum]|uniref:Uncharacterized protein n=1 Tax=Fusarium albosuccineum TaxID=1237068 RepID=A0A8H4LBA0_9HYPO|nr:hypothetical protein FALBO_8588 [Fusarium albosuccineum]
MPSYGQIMRTHRNETRPGLVIEVMASGEARPHIGEASLIWNGERWLTTGVGATKTCRAVLTVLINLCILGNSIGLIQRQILPQPVDPSAPWSSVKVILGSKTKPWFTKALKPVSQDKHPLNNVDRQQRCLLALLSLRTAIWTLASIMLPNRPEADFSRDPSNPLVEAITNYELFHIEAYPFHIDMALSNKVAFKPTKDTIDSLVKFHEEVHCVDAMANTSDWPDKEKQCKELHEEFIFAINRLVLFSPAKALEGLEEGGAGELLGGMGNDIKEQILSLLKPLIPPCPSVDVVTQLSRLTPIMLENKMGLATGTQWVHQGIDVVSTNVINLGPQSVPAAVSGSLSTAILPVLTGH